MEVIEFSDVETYDVDSFLKDDDIQVSFKEFCKVTFGITNQILKYRRPQQRR